MLFCSCKDNRKYYDTLIWKANEFGGMYLYTNTSSDTHTVGRYTWVQPHGFNFLLYTYVHDFF